MAFWQVFILFSLLSALFMLWPFVKTLKSHKLALRIGARSDVRDAIIEDRKAELLRAKSEGELDEEEFNALEKDLSRTRHTQEATRAEEPEHAVTYGGNSQITIWVLSILIPLSALLVYFQYGAKPDWEIAEDLTNLPNAGEHMLDDGRSLQGKIIERVKQTPENANLWFLLGNLSAQLGDFDASVKSYRQLKSLYPDSPVIIAELAQALFLRAGNVVTPEVRKNAELALSLDPDIPTALGLVGIDAFQQQDYQTAIAHWEKALRKLAPDSPASQALSEGVVRARAALGIRGESAEKNAGKKEVTASVNVRVTLGEEVEGLEGNEALFVYARAWQGPRMPLAIQRIAATGFPLNVTLDTSMAMAAGMDITSVAQLELVARISKSGNAVPQSGDWSGHFGPVILGEQNGPIELVISERTP